MKHHEIQNFLTLAETLHFGRASQICHLSASTLTRSIQRLEEEVGEALFVRDNRRVELTPTGEKFRLYAVQAVKDWEIFQEKLKGEAAIGGVVSLYASVTAVYSLLPDLLERYRASYPDVQLELRTGAAEEAVQQVLKAEIDLAVAALPDREEKRLEFMPLTETDLVFIGPRDLQEIPMSDGQLDLSETPLVLPRSGLSRRRLDQYLKKKAIRPRINTEVSGNEAIIAMVRLGCGVGIVPELVLERSPLGKEVKKIAAAPKLAPYIVGLCSTRRNLSRPSVAALWELARAQSLRD